MPPRTGPLTTLRSATRRDTVRLRPLTRYDPAVDAVFAGLSPHSRYLRFHTPMPRLTGSVRHALHDVDGRRHAGLVAEVGSRRRAQAVGIARLIALDGTNAELALAVADRWQGRGIGRRLLAGLGELARELGYRELHGTVLPDNQGVVRLLRRAFPGSRVRFSGGVTQVRCPLDWSAESLTDEDLLADLCGR